MNEVEPKSDPRRLIESAVAQGRYVYVTTYHDGESPVRAQLLFKTEEAALRCANILSHAFTREALMEIVGGVYDDPIQYMEAVGSRLLDVFRLGLGKEAGDAAFRVYWRFQNQVKPADACNGCGGESEMYMLKDEVWLPVAPGPNGSGRLCLSCCEKKLGRTLVPNDFTGALVNHTLLFLTAKRQA